MPRACLARRAVVTVLDEVAAAGVGEQELDAELHAAATAHPHIASSGAMGTMAAVVLGDPPV